MERYRTRLLQGFTRHVLTFGRDRAAATAVVFAIVLLPIFLAIGIAVDYGNTVRGRDALLSAVDAAALFAANAISDGNLDEKAVVNETRAMAVGIFKQNVRMAGEPTVDVRITQTEVTVDARDTFSTYFLALLGRHSVDVAVSSSANIQTTERLDFHFLVDSSDSMGLAADGAARAKLRAVTRNAPIAFRRSCEFACHVSEDTGLEPQSRLVLARKLGIKLRIDAARHGIQLFMNLAGSKRPRLDSRYSLSTFNSDVYLVSHLTDNDAAFNAALSTIEVAYRRSPGEFGDTFFNKIGPAFIDSVMLETATAVPAATQHPYIIIVGDGVRSGYGQTLGNGGLAPYDQSVCNAFKSAGFTVAVIYTRYYSIPTDEFYMENVSPIFDQIEPNMRACASKPSLFAAGDTPEEINAAFAELFKQILQQRRIVR